jgi:hypothetical protein
MRQTVWSASLRFNHALARCRLIRAKRPESPLFYTLAMIAWCSVRADLNEKHQIVWAILLASTSTALYGRSAISETVRQDSLPQ